MRTLLAAAAVGGAIVATGTAVQAQQARELDGARVFAVTCGQCHNPRSSVERTDREWTVIVAHMRVRANLSGAEARAVRAFLQSMNEPPAGAEAGSAPAAGASAPANLTEPLDEALAARGRELVRRYNCVACHKLGDATAGTLDPDLNTVLRRRTVQFFWQKVTNPAFDNPNSMMPRLGLSADELRAVLEYVRSVQR